MKNRIDLEKKEAVGQIKPCSSRLISEVQRKQGVRRPSICRVPSNEFMKKYL